MSHPDPDTRKLRAVLDGLDSEIGRLVSRRDSIAAELIRHKGKPPYDPAREHEIAGKDAALWLPLLRRVRTAEGARLPLSSSKPGAFPPGDFTLIAGPCSVDDRLEENLEVVARAGLAWVRAGAWKPRTFPWSFQGEGLPALQRLRDGADKLGLKVVSEVLSELDAPAAAELVDVVQVGARNAQNFALLKLLAGLGKPVLLKRGPSCTIEEWLGAAAYLDGHVPVSLCERGVRGFDPCFRNLLDLAGAVLARQLGGFQTLIDPSHGTGIAGLVAPMVFAARAAGLDGALVELHVAPDESPSDGDQALRVDELRELVRALAPTEKSAAAETKRVPVAQR
ncbi:MAG TPA: 3-deoxy-7-phosphoheptulonate synthase [Planctomycetota bacterium]|jgi:3-deoxy-7-phosphoheptulonate synthase|nr:3-deoxy-7-phosphoheptulonate synthase [Planctomycetota bacterium]